MTSAEKLPSSSNTEIKQPPHLPLCANPGNPVFSCMLDPKTLTTNSFLTKPQILLFKTTSSEYGAIPPTSQMVPCTYHPKDQTFSTHLLTCGSFRNSNLNTALDRSRVCDYPNLQHTL
ncbi:uncharacterized protein C15orf65 homolog [Apteryx rowi]|uniref:Chromosome 15 open reading frame 65 n=1 Tax=Apteryx owenii TaxID=8824 RepID=A0A8B9S7W0_APTOW|nr:PREDICTED: uncharacterized protein C15orf65 homolog [Apteryx mantelli mantelli]XP_025916689.1 uncharacterized protein C15orf65 homolog [Apteryx rowi]